MLYDGATRSPLAELAAQLSRAGAFVAAEEEAGELVARAGGDRHGSPP